jgi:hypothetical protein
MVLVVHLFNYVLMKHCLIAYNQKKFSCCIFNIITQAKHFQDDNKQFMMAEVKEYDIYAYLPRTRELAIKDRMVSLRKEGDLIS